MRYGTGQAAAAEGGGSGFRRWTRAPHTWATSGDAGREDWPPGARSGEPNEPTPSIRRYRHLTSRENNKLRPTQAQTVIAAAILRHLHAVITTGRRWDPAIATHGSRARHGLSGPIWAAVVAVRSRDSDGRRQ
jgi:hypothetical protein